MSYLYVYSMHIILSVIAVAVVQLLHDSCPRLVGDAGIALRESQRRSPAFDWQAMPNSIGFRQPIVLTNFGVGRRKMQRLH